jgi:16S rRNA G1207 methylase RsmC
VALDGFAQPFVNHSNLFSRDKLDRGTRFLLENLPAEIFESVLDLGCGNGILGIAFKLAHPSAQVIFSDESKMAILSASENYRNFFGDPAQFYWTHCFPSLLDGTVDLVLCNPPFHQGTSIVDTVALEMFRDGRRILRTGGVMRVIGNHHLNYPSTLKKTFGNSRIVASNDKFTIVDAIKSYL